MSDTKKLTRKCPEGAIPRTRRYKKERPSTRRYSHLCDMVGQLSEIIEPEFLTEITELETDIVSARMDARRLGIEDPNTSEALLTILNEIQVMLGKIWEAKGIPSMKGTLALLKAWPEPSNPLKRVTTIVYRASLIADKARVRVSMLKVLEYCREPVRDEEARRETRRYYGPDRRE